MTVFHPARWKKVASGQPDTNSSHLEKSAACSSGTRTASEGAAFTDGPTGGSSSSSRLIAGFQEQPVHPVPLEVAEQRPDPALHCGEVDVVPEAGLQADAALARLPGVDLPGMKIENARLAVDGIHALQAPARHAVRQQPEIAAAASRQVAIEEAHRGDGDLQQPAAAFGIEREARRAGHPVVIVVDGIDARAVSVSGLAQTLECPQIALPDREAL